MKEIDLGLERVSLVWKRLRVEKKIPVYTLTVAGTNGKGSSVALLESILLAEGYKVGVYSTPHLIKYNERIRLNGQSVSNERITAAFSLIDQARGSTSLSYFEFGTLAALVIFEQQRVDIQILEVGLGGRLDAVNIIDANAALITSIDIDHVDWLGDDRSNIALEKAGIFRVGQKAVCSDSTVPKSLVDFANKIGTDLSLAGRDFFVDNQGGTWLLSFGDELKKQYRCPALKGSHQVQNAAGVISLLAYINKTIPVKQSSVDEGLRNVSLAGRLQQVACNPDIYLDVAHNQESAKALANFIQEIKGNRKTHAVFSILADKNLTHVIEPFRKAIDHWHVAPLNIQRAQSIDCLVDSLAKEPKQSYSVYSSIKDAYQLVKSTAKQDDLVICFGSFYVVEACLDGL